VLQQRSVQSESGSVFLFVMSLFVFFRFISGFGRLNRETKRDDDFLKEILQKNHGHQKKLRLGF